MKEYLFHIIFSTITKNVLNLANSTDPDEAPHFAGVCKCSLFGIICKKNISHKTILYLVHCVDYSAHDGHFD